MSVAEGLALAYLKVGAVGAVIVAAILLLVRMVENRGKARARASAASGGAGDDGISR